MKSKKNEEGQVVPCIYLSDYAPVSEDEVVFGRDIAVSEFVKWLLCYGTSAKYQFFYTKDILQKSSYNHHNLLDAAVFFRKDVSIGIEDVNCLKKERASFDFDIWHEVDADFSKAISLRERYGPKVYPISATFHVLSYQHLLHDWYLEILLKQTFRYDTLICTSRAARKALHNTLDHISEKLRHSHNIDLKYNGSTEIIPLGVDTDLFKPRDKKQIRHQLGLPKDAFIILWIGRISPLDKADLIPFLLVIKKLINENASKEIKLVLGGTGEEVFNKIIDDAIIDMKIEDFVIVVRPLLTNKRHLYHACADVFVSPVDNIQETFGITPIEAMASGVPQVVSDWDGYRDTVVNEHTGFLIPTFMADLDQELALKSGIYENYNLMDHFDMAQSTVVDLEAYRVALQVLINTPSLCQVMSENSRKRALEIYDWKNIIYSYERLWEMQKELARDQSPVEKEKSSYDIPTFYKNFKHYASKQIVHSTEMFLSETGRQVANKSLKLASYYDAIDGLSTTVLIDILRDLLSMKGQTFESLKKQFSNESMSHEKVGRHIMWLLKYDYLRVRYHR